MQVLGRVVDRETHRAKAGLRVEAWANAGSALVGLGKTDARGRFRIAVEDGAIDRDAPVPDVVVHAVDGDVVLGSSEGTGRWDEEADELELTIEIGAGDGAANAPEIGLHELGESIAVVATSVQRELARYPNALGAFVVDDVDIEVPIKLRIDSLGQMLATVVDGPTEGAARMHFRVRPVVGAAQAPPAYPAQPLAALKVLTTAVRARLEVHRIFSVDDLLRVARTAAGRTALERMELGVGLDEVLRRAEVLALPVLPPRVAEELLELGLESPAEFVHASPRKLAGGLSKRLGERIGMDDVGRWQEEVRELVAIVPDRPRRDGDKKRGGTDAAKRTRSAEAD